MTLTPIVVFLPYKKSSLSVFVVFLYLGVCISIQPIKIPLSLSTDGRLEFCCGKWAHSVCNQLRGANFLSFLIPVCTMLKSSRSLKQFGLGWGCRYFKTVWLSSCTYHVAALLTLKANWFDTLSVKQWGIMINNDLYCYCFLWPMRRHLTFANTSGTVSSKG